MIRTGLVLAMCGLMAACLTPRSRNGSQGGSVNAEQTPDKSAQQADSQEARTYRKECEQALQSARNQLSAMEQPQSEYSLKTVLEPFNGLLMILDSTSGRAGLLRNVHPDAGLREAADWCEQEVSKLQTDVGLSRPLFEAMSKLDLSGMDAVTRRYVEHVLRDFRRSGVDKEPEVRQKIRALKEELVKVGQEFDKNIRSDVRFIELDSKEALKGLPEDYIQAHQPGENGKIKVTTDYPDVMPFMTYAENDAARLDMYKQFRLRGWPANEAVLNKILSLRYELATMLGYGNWADYITEDKMIQSAKAASTFIDTVSQVAEERAGQDLQQLLKRLRKIEPNAVKVGDWQKGYIAELVKREDFQLDSQVMRPYFSYDKVKQGLLDLTSRLFGLTYKRVDVPVWHPDVEAFEIRDGDGLIGRFYLDMHPRADKFKHAAAFPIRSGVLGVQVPEAALVCNFPPGLMEHADVQTFFHEFGHLLHHLLAGRQRWVGVSGIATEWDFVEVPSQLLEEWSFDYDVLKMFAVDETGRVIPAELVQKLRHARDFGKGIFVRHQMFYAALSLDAYNRSPEGLDLDSLVKDLQTRYSPFEFVAGTHMQDSFGHLFGYSAIYYTYMWSLVIAKDMLGEFQQKGMLNEELARRYRKTVLEPGGSKDAAVLVKDFLGRDFNFDSFAAWLNAG